MKEFIEKLVGKLEEEEEYETDGKNYNAATAYEKAIEIVKQLAGEYMTCYKSCTECEVYDKEKHHCPKFCYIIEETVKEIEENHSGWIPCGERLPEVNGWYLVTNELGVVQQQYWGASHWQKLRDDAVVAWRELPAPYQPKGE